LHFDTAEQRFHKASSARYIGILVGDSIGVSFIVEQAGGKGSDGYQRVHLNIHEYDHSILDIADHHSQMRQIQLQLWLYCNGKDIKYFMSRFISVFHFTLEAQRRWRRWLQ